MYKMHIIYYLSYINIECEQVIKMHDEWGKINNHNNNIINEILQIKF